MDLAKELRGLPGVDPDWNDDEILADVGVRLANYADLQERCGRIAAELSMLTAKNPE